MSVHREQQIKDLANAFFQEVKGIREHLHQHPELSFEENNTMEFVAQELEKTGIPFVKSFGGTGVIGWLKGKNDQKEFTALRADLDALPIQEKNNTSYTSKVDGVMHACGHDVHTSVLLGTAKILKALEPDLPNPVLFVFQPGEEKAPGGASILIKEGLFEKWKVAKMLALHVYPEMETGKVGFRKGLYMASCDEIHVTIIGKGGHAAMPHACTDVIQAGAELVRNLPLSLHRKCDPKIPMVLSFGHFEALGATNVLPDQAKLKGTFRTMNEDWRESALHEMKEYAKTLEMTTKCKVEFEIVRGYPFLVNDENVTEELRIKAIQQLGEGNVEELPMRMTAEDFSFYTHKVPCSFFRLGVRNESQGITFGVHHPNFDIDPKALITGMEVMAAAVLLE